MLQKALLKRNIATRWALMSYITTLIFALMSVLLFFAGLYILIGYCFILYCKKCELSDTKCTSKSYLFADRVVKDYFYFLMLKKKT